jgi:hypothetical protein
MQGEETLKFKKLKLDQNINISSEDSWVNF